MTTRVLVTGAGGFIGHHLVTYLKKLGYWVRGVDIKEPEYSESDADEFELLDLRRWDNCLQATRNVEEVYGLAADMGGMGFISNHHAHPRRTDGLVPRDQVLTGMQSREVIVRPLRHVDPAFVFKGCIKATAPYDGLSCC